MRMISFVTASILSLSSIAFPHDLERRQKPQTKSPKQQETLSIGSDEHFGWLSTPVLVPNITIRTVNADGKRLREALMGKTTAIHLMYTSCKSSCPIQGRVFSKLAPQLNEKQQLISLSVDVANDQKQSLKAWREQYPPTPRWIATVPQTETNLADVMNAFGLDISQDEPHMNQVYFIDSDGRLVFKTGDFPTQKTLQMVFTQISAKSSTTP